MAHILYVYVFFNKLNSDNDEILTLLFKCDGVLPEMIMYIPKEQWSSDFRKKICEANCHQTTITPHSFWSTAAEMNID